MVITAENVTDVLAGFRHEFCLLLSSFNFGKKKGRSGKGNITGNVKVSDLSHDI